MYLEYCNYNRQIENYADELKKVFSAIDYGIKGLNLPIHMIKETREYMPKDLVMSAPIDYPMGHSSSKVKYGMVINSLKSGANAIDYVPNHYLLKNKFSLLVEEIEAILNICEDHDASFRLFLDYTNSDAISVTAKIYDRLGINSFFPSLGYHHEDFFDNLINCAMLEQESYVFSIFNGQMWRKDQVKTVMDSGLFGLRVYNLDLLV